MTIWSRISVPHLLPAYDGLIAAGIGVAILTVVNTVGGSLVSIFTVVANDLTTAAK